MLFDMCVKFGHSLYDKNVEAGRKRTGCWGEYGTQERGSERKVEKLHTVIRDIKQRKDEFDDICIAYCGDRKFI
jgi:hypothetical protein